MPVIKNYRQQIGGLGVQQRRAPGLVTTGEAEARGIQQLAQVGGKVIEQAVGREERQNLSDLNVELTNASRELSEELLDLQKNANLQDREAFNKQFEDYNKRVKDRMSKVGESVKGRVSAQHFAKSSASIEAQMSRGAINTKTDLQGAIAVNQEKISANNDATSVMANPSSFKEVMARSDARIDLILDLPAAKRMEHKSQTKSRLAQSAVRGWIKLDPEYAKEKLKGEIDPATGAVKGGDYAGLLTGDQQRQLIGEADQAIRAKEIERQRQISEQRRLKKERDNVTQNGFLEKMNEGKLTTKEVLDSDLESFGSGSKEQFMQMLKTRASKAKITTSPSVMTELFERIHLPDGDPNKLTDENDLNKFFGRGLNHTDLVRLRKEMQGLGTQAGSDESLQKNFLLDSAKRKLTRSNPLIGIVDTQGDKQYQKFLTYFLNEYNTKRQEGVPAGGLLNPNSKDYIGNAVDQFVRSPKEIMQDMARSLNPKPANGGLANPPIGGAPKESQKKLGETPAEYLKRMKEGK